MNSDIEDVVRRCQVCKRYQRSNIKEPMILREFPESPFENIASDILEYGDTLT